MKLPDYIVREMFLRLVDGARESRSGGRMLLKGNCPKCGEKRQRFYLKDYGDDHMVYCHNGGCGYSKPFYSFLKQYHPNELVGMKEMFLENVSNGNYFKKQKIQKRKKLDQYMEKNRFSKLDYDLRLYMKRHGFPITQKQEIEKKERFRRKCLKNLKERRIQKEFVKDFWCFTKGPLKGYFGIPFWDKDGKNLVHIQGRRMFTPKDDYQEKWNPKYKFLKDLKSKPLIDIPDKPLWGMWRVDPSQAVVICEGTLDACAFRNGVATCGVTVSESLIQELEELYPHRVWCVDSYWHDEAGREMTQKLLEMGEKCFIIPKGEAAKDANGLLIDKEWDIIDESFLQENIYWGKAGLLKLKMGVML